MSAIKQVEDLLGIELIHWARSHEFGKGLFHALCGKLSTPYCVLGTENIHKVTCITCLDWGLKHFMRLSGANQNIVINRIKTLKRRGYE